MYDLTHDEENDQQSLTFLLTHFHNAYLDFDIEPHLDEVSEMASWTRSVFEFGSRLEDEYGVDKTKRMFGRSWEEVKRG